MTEKKLDTLIEDTAQAIKAFGERLRVKAHLAGMEAKDTWQDIRPNIDALEERLRDGVASIKDELQEGVGEEMRHNVRQAVMEARDRFAEVEPKINKVVNTILEATESVGNAIEDAVGEVAKPGAAGEAAADTSDHEERRARVKARAKEQREKLEAELRQAGRALEEAAVVALDEMRGAFVRMRERLGGAAKGDGAPDKAPGDGPAASTKRAETSPPASENGP